MKMTGTALLAFALAAAPVLADRKVDEAVAKANEQAQKGKPEEGLKTLQKLPPSAEGLTALGRFQERIGDLDGAAASLDSAVKQAGTAGPARAETLTVLASLDLVRGSSKDALAHAEEAAKLQPSAASLAVLARVQARTGNAASALQTAEQALQAGATSAEAHEAKGEALLAAGKGAEAAAAFGKALETDTKLTRARTGLARSLLAQGKAAEAAAEARKVTEADPKSAEGFAVLGTAILTENKNNWSDAIAQAQQGAFLNQRSCPVQVAVGKIFEAQGNLDQASNAYRKALEVDPDCAPAQVAQVLVQANRGGDIEKILPEIKKIAEALPHNGEVQLALGRILLRKGDYVAAVQPLERAAAALPSSAEAHAFLGTAYQYARQSAEALEAYKKAVALAPQNVDYRATYGLLLGLAKQYDAGIAELKKVVATPGYKDTAGYTNLGWIYRNMEPGRPEESVAAYKKALELDAKNEQAALGMGWAYSYLKRYDDAIAAFKKAIELEPKTAGEAYNGIAWCYYFKKDMPQAKAMAEKAKQEGRNVSGLLANIDKVEKGQAQADQQALDEFKKQQQQADEPDLGGVGNKLMKGSPADKIRAAAALVRFGKPAIQFLVYGAINDPNLDVREAAIDALGSMGAAAKETCAQLKQIANFNPFDSTIMDKKQMESMVRYGDLQKAARAASGKIGCN